MYISLLTAAGESTRFPSNKLLFQHDGEPVIVKSIRSALESRLSLVIVVVGYMRDSIVKAVKENLGENNRVVFVENPSYREGMSSSIKKGVSFILSNYRGFKGVLISPGDAAWIPSVVYDILVDKHETYGWDIIVPAYDGRRGHPIFFSRNLAQELLSIDERTKGLKRVVRDHWYEVRDINLPFSSILLDLDTIVDLNRVKELAWK